MTYTIEQLEREPDTLNVRQLPDGRVLAVHVQITNWALTITNPEDLQMGIRSDLWEYSPDMCDSLSICLLHLTTAFRDWDGEGEPHGWTRHPPSGRRRWNGNPTREEIRP